MINYGIIRSVIGFLLLTLSALMIVSISFSILYKEGDGPAILLASGITALTGAILRINKPERRFAQVRKREGYLIVALGWLAMVLFSSLPYWFSGVVDHPIDALFESISGMTTTGASIISDIEKLPRGILFWRSLTQWIGGMGIIVLTVALFPLLGIGGIELFVAEAPGPTSDKLHPRIQETAKRLWFIYVGLTILLFFILWALGMSSYDAINHALTTMATGGFSTKNESMAAFSAPSIQYVIIFFMFLAGTNYTVIYWSLRGKFSKVWRSDEFRLYLCLVLLLTLVLSISIFHHTGMETEQGIRAALFQVVSLMTTTGFVSADYTSWGPVSLLLIFILLFVGACAGSTSGGIKLVRHLVFLKNCILEFKRLLHPRAIIPLKLNGERVNSRVMTHILVFLLLYMALFVFGSIVVSTMGLDFETAISSVATSLGNVGPGIGGIGPTDNFAWLPLQVKAFLSLLMLLGRLELFTILILFTPYFWKSN